jgi:UDP-N-acetylglucosamine diphosphorylase/glucosamine-1-phosphate N-acetyltransferase
MTHLEKIKQLYPNYQIYIIGANASAEIKYGNILNLTTVWLKNKIKPKYHLEEADYEITKLADLNTILDPPYTKIKILILAAGKGTRMNSDLPKVLHKIKGKEMISYVVDVAEKISKEITIIVGHKGEEVIEKTSQWNHVWQREQLGTGHAVMMAENEIHKEDVLILYGDVPAIKEKTLQRLINQHKLTNAGVTILTTNLKEPFGYGRMVREKGKIKAIVEEKDASPEEKKITEVNTGIMVIKGEFLIKAIREIKTNNYQKEYYLTDIVKIAHENEVLISSTNIVESVEVKGVNTIKDKEEIEEYLK